VLAVIVLGAATVVIAVNTAVGKPRAAEVKTELPALGFSAVGKRGFPSKSKALEQAREIRERGGAGYVDFDGEWFVIEEIGVGDMEFCADGVEVKLVDDSHKAAFEAVVKSFEANCLALNALVLKPARDAAAETLNLYNELLAQIAEFDKLQTTPPNEMYSKISIAANKQLLALFMVKENENISSVIKHSICSVNFAYLELLKSL
jgi:hypothetical protein